MSNNLITLDGYNLEAELRGEEISFCSFVPDSKEGQAILFKAMNNPTNRISDMINKQICVKDVYCEVVQVTNAQGEVSMQPRTVLIDMNGDSYQCVSTGIFSAVKKLCRVFGMPTWEEGVTVEVKQVKSKERQLLTLDVVI